MKVDIRLLLSGLCLPVILSSCFFETTGCTDNVCVSASTDSCSGDSCDDELFCEDTALIEQRLAEIISSARSKARDCGQDHFDKANTVFWNAKLKEAALRHSTDMASKNFLSHTGSDGSTVAQRATEANYNYQLLAENIAGGQQTSTAVVNDWLNSSGHCANIMSPGLKEIGAACVKDPRTDYETYWTLVLAAPRTP